MNRKTDIGWPELILGTVLIIIGVIMLKQPSGFLMWLVAVCGIIAICTGVADIVLYVRMERFTGFGPVISLITGILGVMAGFMLLVHPGAGTADLDHCPLYFKTFSSELYSFQTGNNVLLSVYGC